MKKYKLQVTQEIINYMERLWYENQICIDNISFILSSNANNPSILDSPTFKAYEDKQAKAKYSYEIAKNEFTSKQIPKIFKEHQCNWEIDFVDRVVIITQLCNCNIDISNIEGVEPYEN